MELDALDTALLRALREDARRSYRELAQALGTTTPTVSARVKALEDLGVLQGYHARVAPEALGGRRVLVRVRVPPSAAARVAESVAALAGVEEVLLLAGGALEARLRMPSHVAHGMEGGKGTGGADPLARLHEALAALPEVQGYEVAEVLRSAPGSGGADAALPDRVEVPCHQCRGPIHGEGVRQRLEGRAHVFCCRQCLADFGARLERHLGTGPASGQQAAERPGRASADAPRRRGR